MGGPELRCGGSSLKFWGTKPVLFAAGEGCERNHTEQRITLKMEKKIIYEFQLFPLLTPGGNSWIWASREDKSRNCFVSILLCTNALDSKRSANSVAPRVWVLILRSAYDPIMLMP